MEDNNKLQQFKNIWSIKDEVISKNDSFEKEKYDIPETEQISTNINGFIINSIGNIVAKFGFFISNQTNETIEVEISPDGFMGGVYHKKMNILIGFGHSLGIDGLLNTSETSIITLSPDLVKDGNFVLNFENDDDLKTKGVMCVIRDTDVLLDILPTEIKEDFIESCKVSEIQELERSELEISFSKYLQKLFEILGEEVSIEKQSVNMENNHE